MDTNKVTIEDVKKIAELSNLQLSDDEIIKLSEMFTDTLKYMDELNELDTENVDETYHVTGLTNVFQKDDEYPTTLEQADALRNASKTENNLFVTKAVFDRE